MELGTHWCSFKLSTRNGSNLTALALKDLVQEFIFHKANIKLSKLYKSLLKNRAEEMGGGSQPVGQVHFESFLGSNDPFTEVSKDP